MGRNQEMKHTNDSISGATKIDKIVISAIAAHLTNDFDKNIMGQETTVKINLF